ncbi:MAG: hypothetical protein LLF83_10445 [Methanobacterium sp.]|nr:hypothetical protein [Methanobacterium sp.]
MDRWYLNRITVIGILLILIGVLIYKVDLVYSFTTSLFYPLLLGSSEGKAVLLLIFMGSMLILNMFITSSKISSRFASMDIWDSRRYLKYALIIILFTYAMGILMEIWLRLYFGVSFFTVFVSLNPDVSSTSIIHSHIFKSALASLISIIGTSLPSNIHTADSLSRYVAPLAYIIVLTLPLVYLTSLISMDKRMDHYKVIIAFAASLSLIGMMDGGLFSNPAIIGFAGLLGMYFIKKPFSMKNLLKPTLIVLILILAGLSCEIAGSNSNYHQITLINQTEPIDWSAYNISTTNNQNDTIIRLKSTHNDRETLINLFNTIKGKADGFFITWNFYSYF